MLIMRRRTRLGVLFATVPLVVFTMVGGFLSQAAAREDTYRHLRVFEDVVSLIAGNYVEEVDLDAVMKGALRGLAGGLDPDSAFLAAEDVSRLEAGTALPEGELGLELTQRYYIQIVAARDDSPAARAGLTAGDYLRTIDGKTTRFVSAVEAERLLRGEPGTTGALSLLRGTTQEPYDIELTRERVSAPNVTDRLIEAESGSEPDAQIGYVRVAEFIPGVAQELKSRIDGLAARGANRIVIDVRNTAGGLFEEGIAAARLFVATGTLLRRTEHDSQEIMVEATAGSDAFEMPVVLLTNPGTAHAAELFVASLTSTGRAETVGQRTGGRVSLQRLVKLSDGTGLWLSWARYLTGDGSPLHRFGVAAMVEVETPFIELGEPWPADDAILERGLDHLRTLS